MQVSKHGFMVQTVRVFLTMILTREKEQYIEVIPEFHKDYRRLKAMGYKVIDRFEVF